jgi:hypothetical protein
VIFSVDLRTWNSADRFDASELAVSPGKMDSLDVVDFLLMKYALRRVLDVAKVRMVVLRLSGDLDWVCFSGPSTTNGSLRR